METEGVTKFQLEFEAGHPLDDELLRELSAWRRRLYDAGLIHRHPQRYGGLGYGNISRKLSPFDAALGGRFAVSGTQTSHLADLTADHYAIVLESHPRENRIVATGPIHPSSEAMTHGMIYSLRPAVQYVLHVHSPAIWKNARRLALPVTDPSAAYGTPEMTREVERLFTAASFAQKGLFLMGGHEDGVVSFGSTLDDTGTPLMELLEKANRF